ncbi:MAG: alpha/beta fold hydrolase [Magnetococcales bacterium]|nr:alpha/beta fold hydrolase [Magnetococcales bacterium]
MPPSRSPRRFWLRLPGLLLAGIFLWLGLSAGVVYTLTHRLSPPSGEPLPLDAHGWLEEVRLTTRDGLDIGGWFAPGKNHRALVLLLHGNGGRRSDWLGFAHQLHQQGIGVMGITFRGHGDSAGGFNDLGYGGRWDVLAALDYIKQHNPKRPIVVVGFSLGAAAALFAGEEARLAGWDYAVQGYVLESPYPDIGTALDHRLEIYLPAGLDQLAGWGIRGVAPWMLPHWPKIAPVNSIRQLPPEIPILFLEGELDQRVTREDITRLIKPVSEQARRVPFKRARHGEARRKNPQRYLKSVLELIQRAEKNH